MPVGDCKDDPESESKHADEKEASEDAKRQDDDGNDRRKAPAATLELVSVECGPSDCPVEERLELFMEFTLSQPLRDALWEVKFLVDSVNERHVVYLGATDPVDYARGVCSMQFEVAKVSVEGIKPCTLANTGLLVAVLKKCSRDDGDKRGRQRGNRGGEGDDDDDEDGVATVNMVVQVSNVGQGRLRRCIYSPLE